MLLVKKGDLTARVSEGAFEALKTQGWEIASAEGFMPQKHSPMSDMRLPDPDEESSLEDENDQEYDEEDLSEKPLGSMSLGELTQLAEMHNINIEGLRTKKEVRTAIREAMSEEG